MDFSCTDTDYIRILQTNPLNLMKYINQKVEVKCNSRTVVGTVYTIDPVSQMIALMKKNEAGKIDMHLILSSHFESIEIIGPSDFVVTKDLFISEEEYLDGDEKSKRRKKLMIWLQSHMIPITEDGDVLKLKDVLTIHPPYNSNNCYSKNEIILEKIQNLISSMCEK